MKKKTQYIAMMWLGGSGFKVHVHVHVHVLVHLLNLETTIEKKGFFCTWNTYPSLTITDRPVSAAFLSFGVFLFCTPHLRCTWFCAAFGISVLNLPFLHRIISILKHHAHRSPSGNTALHFLHLECETLVRQGLIPKAFPNVIVVRTVIIFRFQFCFCQSVC